MALKNTVNAIELFGISSVVMDSNAYQPISNVGLPFPCFLVRIINNSDEDVTVSYDGVTDHDFVAQKTTLQLPLQANSQPSSYVALMGKGTMIYVKGTSGDGDVYLAAYYQQSVV